MIRIKLRSPAKSNRQIQEYVSAVDRGMSGRFVVPTEKGWHVRKPASKSGGSYFSSKSQAIAYAKSELSQSKGSLFVFDKRGNLSST